MRKLLCAACGYALALLLAHYALPLEALPWLALAAALLSLCGLLLRGDARCRVLTLLLSAAVGFAWYWGYDRLCVAPADAFAGETRTVTVLITDDPAVYEDYTAISARSLDDTVPHVAMRIYDYAGGMTDLRPGDVADLPLKLLTAGTFYGVEDDYYLSEGVLLRGYLKGTCPAARRWSHAWLLLPKTIARAVKTQAAACFPADVAPLMTALLTGDRRAYYADDALSADMQTAGFTHIIAVSGMHMAFLIGALTLLVGKRRNVALIGIPLMLVFAAMVGFRPSVVRALVMQSFLMLAPLLRRENDSLTSLSAAAMLLLLCNPIAIASLSFQLSFAAMLGLILVTPRVYAWLTTRRNGHTRLPRGVWGKLLSALCAALSAALGALTFTAPLTALHFGFVPLYGVLTNLLCLWAMSTAFLLGYPVCLLGLLWQGLGRVLGWTLAWLPRYTIFVVRHIARLPWAAVYTRYNLGGWWLVFTYAVLLISYALRGRERYRPVLPLCLCVFALAAISWLPPAALQGKLRLAALDVGQGQSLALLTERAAVLIDCGGTVSAVNAGDTAAAYLGANGRDRVDLLVLTHFHADHANGVARLLHRTEVRRLAYPTDCESNEYMTEILDLCARAGTELLPVSENTDLTVDGLELRLYAPLGSAAENERGLLIRGAYGAFDFLVTGDAGSGVEQQLTGRYDLGDLEVLVAGHHGSRYSTGAALLDDTTPEAVIISVGAGNSYGHPTQEVLDRLAERNIELYRTDLDGTVEITVGKDDGEEG